jgi:polar amino acid transport system substrate-binding protein
MRGDIMHDYALERGYGETVETTQSQADALRALAAGQGDCVLSAVLPARYWIRELRLSNLRQTGPILVSYRYCYASKKGNAEILSQFSEGLAILRQTGEYQEIYDKWLGALEPRGFSRKTVLLTLLAVLVPLVIVTGLIVAWSWSLRSLVRARTMELEYALDLQRKSEEERLRLQGRIQQAQKHESLTRVTGGVAHHFNNIMHVISGNSQMILEETPPDSLPHTLAQEILNSAQRAIDISSQMGLFAGRDGERFEEVDLGGLIKEMEPLLRAGTASHHEFRAETAGRIPRVKGDPAQIRQALTNLATNADEALGKVKDGRIILRAGNLLIEERARLDGYWAEKPKPGRYAFVEVEDNGAGIESDALERVFDPFFSTKFPGRGLGLAAVLGVVRGLHGGVRVESRIGKGTRVQLLFPVEEKGSGVSS